MKLSADQFRNQSFKSITLLGMSGIGKTALSKKLSNKTWFHYSGDYRIGTRYLDEVILDNVKQLAMQQPELRELLRSDSIYIRNNVTFDHLEPLSSFLGKLGNPDKGGLELEEFKRRQLLFRDAELNAMLDARQFMHKARTIYGYNHFLNDAGGSICSFNAEECWDRLAEDTLILYLKADPSMLSMLTERAKTNPKPLSYDIAFLNQMLTQYFDENKLDCVADIDPDDFVGWVFPHLVRYREPQYEALAAEYGYTIQAQDVFMLKDDNELMDLICDAIASKENN